MAYNKHASCVIISLKPGVNMRAQEEYLYKCINIHKYIYIYIYIY